MEPLMDRPPHSFFARHPTVRYIRFQWIDISGVLRTRILTKAHCMHLAENAQFLAVGATLMMFPVSDLQIAKLPATGCAELRPDWSSLQHCLFAPTHASVMCFFYIRQSENPYSLCPRSELHRVLNKAETEFKKTFLVGFEIEFVILDPDLQPLRGLQLISTNSSTSGLRGAVLQALEETVDILETSGISVQHVHTEGRYQLEIATGPLPPLKAIDVLMYTHETIKTVFSRHNIVATMAPNAHPYAAKSGGHIHISFNPPDRRDQFLAGMLDKLKLISAFGLANYDSFSRVEDFQNATGTWVSWGKEHRDVPIRLTDGGHWEIRCVDATANLYLVLSLLITAGLEGLVESKALPMDLKDFVSRVETSQLAEMGITERLPVSMEEAINVITDASENEIPISQPLKDLYVAVKEVDLQAMNSMNDTQRRFLFARTF